MKKYRKLISLALALAMVFTFMAMSASAATTEVRPRASTCPQCGGYGYVTDTTKTETLLGDKFTCKNFGTYHAHYKVTYRFDHHCSTCGYATTTYSSYTRCPYGTL